MPAGKYDGERKLSGAHFVSMTVSRQIKKLLCAFFVSTISPDYRCAEASSIAPCLLHAACVAM
jgi:hypothetical protein